MLTPEPISRCPSFLVLARLLKVSFGVTEYLCVLVLVNSDSIRMSDRGRNQGFSFVRCRLPKQGA